jgi:hypothetical protein
LIHIFLTQRRQKKSGCQEAIAEKADHGGYRLARLIARGQADSRPAENN